MSATPIELGRQVLQQQANALHTLADALDDVFTAVASKLLAATDPRGSAGRIVFSGLGKSGLIAQKLSATFTSTGTPAVFLHPVDALHGDIGLVGPADVCIALSKSGSDELVRFVGHFRRLGDAVIAITTPKPGNRLAELADHVLAIPDLPEACPLQLAPMTSTTMMLVLGDALAAALLELRGFSREDFARFHPEGTLGRRLLLRAENLMHQGDELPVCSTGDSFSAALEEMTRKCLGMVCVCDATGRLAGVLTEGDLRRLIVRSRQLLELNVAQALALSPRVVGQRPPPITVTPDTLAVACRELLEAHTISQLVVCDTTRRPVGVVRLHDIVRAGLG